MAQREDHKRNLILKARQFGFTTFYCIDYLDEALWTPGTTCAIIAHEREAADRIFEIVKRAYEHLPEIYKPETKTDTKRALQFTTRYDGEVLDSGIYVALKLRGGTVHNLHITESAFNKDRGELNAGSKQAVPITGRISEETTANGFEEFYDLYTLSAANTNPSPTDYRTYFYAWVENREYTLPGALDIKTSKEYEIIRIAKELYNINVTDGQLIWRRWKINELTRNADGVGLNGEQLFMQEYPLTPNEAFQSGTGNVFDGEKVNGLIAESWLSKEDIIEKLDKNVEEYDKKLTGLLRLYDMGVRLWEIPQFEHKYVIGVDPSDGEGADFSCVDVWHDDDTRQVAQYYGKIRPDELAELIKMIADVYNHAYVGVENNMLSTILFLSKIYDNYYYETRIDEKTAKRTKKIGWSTNIKTRDVMIDDFVIFFDEGHLKIRSNITIGEMRTFIRNEKGKREHAVGKHDDSLFAGFIALQMRKYNKPRARVFENKPF